MDQGKRDARLVNKVAAVEYEGQLDETGGDSHLILCRYLLRVSIPIHFCLRPLANILFNV